jgi:predicted extracellular nuclease
MTLRSGHHPLGLLSPIRTTVVSVLVILLALVASDQIVRGSSPDIVISQVYGGGGNTGAPFRNDFVELFNRGSAAVNLAGKSIQYASAAGTGNFGSSSSMIAVLPSVALAPGQYYLVQLVGGTNGVPLPTPDATGTINMSGTGGKVALVSSTTGLGCNGGSTVCTAAQLALIVDLVGWDGANFYETAPAPATSNTTAVLRAGGGCVDSDNNGSDFTTAAPAPRNTASAVFYCSGPTNPTGTGAATPAGVEPGATSLLTVAVSPGANPTSTGIAVAADLGAIGGSSTQSLYDDGSNGDAASGDNVFSFNAAVSVSTTVGSKLLSFTVSDAQARSSAGSIALMVVPPPMPIHEIQGAGSTSPYVGLTVTTRGIVTARRYNNGFFIQTPDELADADPNTSEAVFVFTSSAPPVGAALGAYVQVTGTAAEYVPDPYGPSVTEITSPTVSALSTTYPMPIAVTLTAADLPASGSLDQLERYEGMRVQVPLLRTISPTQGSIIESSATSTSNGVFYAVIDGVARPFREPGIQVGVPVPAGAPPTVPRFDFNPERLRVDSDGQIGATRIEVTSGALLSNVVGVLDFGYLTWTILPDPSAPPAVSGMVAATPVPMPDANEFTVGSFNLARFYDTVNDPATSDAVLTAAAFENRLNKASLTIRNVMRSPDVLGVQEVENLSTLQALAGRLNADTVAAGGTDPGYVGHLFDGNDPGGIDVGFLVRTSRVTVIDVVQEGLLTTFVNPTTGANDLLNDRPPLVLTAQVQGPSGTLPVTVIVNHLRSLSGVDDPVDGRVRVKRLAQAEFLATLIQARQAANPTERIISVGDYNAYQVSDGYVDVIGSIKGTPASADQVVLAGADLVNPDLADLVDLIPASERYSYSYDGSAQVLDHIIVNGPALQRLSRIQFARSNADFPESYRSDPSRPERVSDHDMPVAYFVFPNAPVLYLNGLNPLPVECCSVFADPGATAIDEDLGDISSLVTVEGSVDPHTVGGYTLTYSVNNGYTTATATRLVNVVDTTAPVLALTGGTAIAIEVGGAFVDPGATAADVCAGDLSGSIAISGSVDTTHVGTYQIVYAVSDGYNTTSVTRTVNVVDTTPPVVSPVSPSPSILWPPNHQFITVRLGYSATDNSGAVACSVGVLSNEPVNGTGDGDTSPDWQVIDGRTVQLRAERAGGGSGRIYTVAVTCRDVSGNTATKSTTVNVPKNKGK